MVAPGSSGQVSLSVYDSLIRWLKTYFAHDAEPLPTPQVRFNADEHILYLRLSAPGAPEKVSVFFSAEGDLPFVRNWRELPEGQLGDTGERIYHIPVSDPEDTVAAYARVTFPGGISVCSPVATVKPSGLGVQADIKAAAASRIVYNGSMGKGQFRVTTNGFFLDDTLLEAKKGPFGITGVGTKKGVLSLSLDTNESFSADRSAMLQMDICSAEPRLIRFGFASPSSPVDYGCVIKLGGGDFWQKIKLSASDMKNPEGKTLPSFGGCRLLTIAGAEGVLFNNLVWI